MRFVLLALVILVAPLGQALAQAPYVPAKGKKAMVATAHPRATEIGVAVLADGGTAFDAAVAVAFALAVVEPNSSGIGGGGYLLYHQAGADEPVMLDFREVAPAKATKDMFLVDGVPDGTKSTFSPLAVAVPGMVRGMTHLLETKGTKPLPELLGPAIALAKDGFPLYQHLRSKLITRKPMLNGAAKAVFLTKKGNVPALGTPVVQSDLAATLEAIATEGAAGFYEGPVADAIDAYMTEAGGLVTKADLQGYQVQVRKPLVGTYRGYTIETVAPSSSGGIVLLELLNILETFDPQGLGWGTPSYYAVLVQAMAKAYEDRASLLGDPAFVTMPVDELVSKAYAGTYAATIQTTAPPTPKSPPAPPSAPEESHTTHFSIVDEAGNVVSCTLSINLNLGSGLVVPGTGILLNNHMDDFAIAPGVPNSFGLVGNDANAVAPGKRPLSSMTPTIVMKDGAPFMAVGGPGGSRIPTSVFQTIVNVVDFGMDIAKAVAAPRIHHQYLPVTIWVEPLAMAATTLSAIESWGYTVVTSALLGNVQAVTVTPKGVEGASDPRGVGQAMGF